MERSKKMERGKNNVITREEQIVVLGLGDALFLVDLINYYRDNVLGIIETDIIKQCDAHIATE